MPEGIVTGVGTRKARKERLRVPTPVTIAAASPTPDPEPAARTAELPIRLRRRYYRDGKFFDIRVQYGRKNRGARHRGEPRRHRHRCEMKMASSRARTWMVGAVAVTALASVGWVALRRAAPAADASLLATVRRGSLTARLTASGTLKPIQSITYRSPLAGRDSEIVELVPEGTRVREGDLLFRLDATELERDVDRAKQDVRQARVDIVV